MTRSDESSNVPPEVRAALGQFLGASKKGADLFAVSEALDAVRRVFPELDVSDGDLMDAISSEALVAGLEIEYDAEQRPKTMKRRALERWENEGGAVRSAPRRKGSS